MAFQATIRSSQTALRRPCFQSDPAVRSEVMKVLIVNVKVKGPGGKSGPSVSVPLNEQITLAETTWPSKSRHVEIVNHKGHVLDGRSTLFAIGPVGSNDPGEQGSF